MSFFKNTNIIRFLAGKFKTHTWSFFLGTVCVILIVLPLFQRGTFIDGLLYKTVAYNYAEGLSSFWNMKFTNSSMTFFCEQPPFYFYLLGWFYKLFGISYLVDRSFTFLLFIALLFILHACLKHVFNKHSHSYLLTLFFLLTIPVFCWSYVNQVIESLLSVEIALGIYFFIRYVKSNKLIYILLFAIQLYLLFLTKGFQSCFLFVFPLSYLILKRMQKTSFYFVLGVSIFLVTSLFATLYFYKPSSEWFTCYFEKRLVLTMNNVGNTTNDHTEIIIRFFTELIICISCVVFLLLFLKFKKGYPLKFVIQNFISNSMALSLFITSLAGSFPYAISLVQRGFYLTPSFICFVLAMVIGLKRYWLFFYRFTFKFSSHTFTRWFVGSCTILTCLYLIMSFNQYKRDQPLLQDLEKILPYLSTNDEVLIEPELWNYFAFQSYLYMAKQVSVKLDCDSCKFLIVSKKYQNQDSFLLKASIQLSTEELDLYYLPKKK